MVGGMNRTISRIRNCPECAALVEMLTKAWELVIERVGAGRQGSPLYHVASIPFALPGIRMSLREEKESFEKQFASRLGLWGEQMLFDEIDHGLADPPDLSPYMDSPLVGRQSRFYFRRLRHDADPFAEYIVRLLEVALEGSKCVLYGRCDGIPDEEERTGLQRELGRLLGAEEEDHGSVEWRGSIGRLRHDLLEGADVPVAAAWTWLGLNQLV